MSTRIHAIAAVLLGVIASCAFERDIPPEEFASEHNRPSCLIDEDCDSEHLCFKGFCTVPCEVDGDCAPGTCNRENGRCIGTAEIGEQCYVSADCAAQQCVQISINETRTGYCTDSCSRPGGCPPPMYCDTFLETCSK